MKVIINSPSLDPAYNVSGISAVTKFIVENNDNVNYIHFEIGRRDNDKGGVFRVLSIMKSLWQWKKLLKANPEALVHFNFALTSLSIYRDSLYIYIARKRKIVVHLHGGNYLFSESTPWLINAVLKRLFLKDIPFIVLSDKEKERVQNHFQANRVHSLPNCIDLKLARQFERSYNNKQLLLGYIGRITETKGMNELLEACKKMKCNGIPFKLILAGAERKEDNYVERFKDSLDTDFEYVGVVSGKAKEEFMKRIEVFVLPSYFEGLPMSLLETMSFGCVPVTTNVGSISTVVTNFENGLFVRVKSTDDLVASIESLYNNSQMLLRIGKSAQKFIFEHFDPDLYIYQLNSIYQNI